MSIKNIICILFLGISTFLSAQDAKQAIASEFTTYQNAIADGDYEKAMEYITPEFFEIYPKEDIIELMEKTLNNPGITFEITDLKIENIEDPRKIDSKHYALLTYSNRMNMKFNNEEEETEESKQSRIGMTRISLEQTFGSNNVSYDPKTEFFGVKAEKSVYAISGNGKTHWKFLVLEKEQQHILERLLPAELTH